MVRRSELLPDERILPLSLAVKAMIGVESLRTRPSGMVSFDNADGTKTIIGGSGTDQIATNAGDTQAPSRPTGLSATSTMQVALVHWDGTLEYGMVDDFDHIEIFAQPDGGDVLDIGYMRTAGELATGRLPVGSVVELWAVAADNAHDLQGNPSPNMSDESDHLVVTIDEPVDQNQIRETAEKLQKSADDAAAKADEAIKQGEQIRQDAQAGIDDARKQAQAAGDKADKAQNDLESQTTALKSSIAAVDAKADQVKAAGGKLSQKVDADKAALDKSIADVDAKAQAASDKGDRLAGQISDMSTTVNGHTTKLDELSTRIEGVASDGQVTVKSLTSLQQTVTGLSSTVTQNTKTASDAMSKASQVEQTANSISANLSKNYTTTANADEKYAAKTELKATADGLQANITRSQQTADGAVTAANKAQATADGFGATLSKDYQTAKASDEKYSTKAELKATSDGLSSSLSSVKQTADGAVTAASKAQQTADVVSLNLSKNYATKSQADATYATQMSLKATSDSLTASINSTAKTAQSSVDKATNLEANLNGFKQTVSETYTTKSDFDKLSIGSRNFLLHTKDWSSNWNGTHADDGTYLGFKVRKSTTFDDFASQNVGDRFFEPDTDYVLSFYARAEKNRTIICYWFPQYNASDTYTDLNKQVSITTQWKRYSVQWHTAVRQSNSAILFRVAQASSTGWAEICGVKLEKGTKPTDWSPAPEDLQTAGDYATNSSLTQTANSIKAEVTEVSKTANGAMSKATTVEQTANGLSSKITEQGKTLNATVKTANEAKSTADSNKTTISQVSTTASNALSKASTVEQNLNGFKTTVSQTYTTKTDFNNLMIGGRNLLLKTSVPTVVTGSGAVNQCVATYELAVGSIKNLPVGMYHIQFKIKSDTAGGTACPQWTNEPWGMSDRYNIGTDEQIISANYYISNNNHPNTTGIQVRLDNAKGKVTIREMKLEKGTKPTDWSPAPEDLQPAGDYATNSSLTQTANQIRGEVSEKYQSKDGMSSYATNSALTQKANEITGKVQEVAKTTQGNTTTISQVSQKADKINTTLSQKIDGKADVSRVSSLEQNLSGFKTTVAQSYQPKGDYPTRSDMQSSISQTASSIKSEVANTYTTQTATEALRKSATRTFTIGGAAGKAKWVELGYLTSNGDDSSVLIHVYSGDGYNGRASQNAEFEIFVKDGWQQSASATGAFGVSVSRIRAADDVKVKVMAFSSTTCNIWAYMPWTHWNGHYTLQGDYKSWQDGPNCGGTRIQDAEPTSGTAQNLAYDTLSTRSYVDQTAKSVALGVVQSYKGSDGSGLATKSDITATKNSITSSVSSTYATKTGVTQEISSKITQNNNSLDVKFSTKTETKNAQDTANTANSHASDAQSRIGSLEDCINMTSQGVRVGKRVNGKWSGWSALVNTEGSYDIFDGAGAKQATFSSGRLDLGKSSHNTNGIYVPAGGNWTSGWLCIDDYLVDCDHTRHIYACARGGLLCFKGRVALTNPSFAGDQRVIDGDKWYQAMQGKYSVYPYLDVDDDERDWPATFKRSDNNLLAVGTLFIPRTTRDIWWYDPTRGKHTMWIDLNNLQIPMGNNVIG
ncbi:hypothetical protein [Bifidobacterium adolescentis]|uniref:Autotransporter adhesin n=1 Tax=Bifidobacterium adolescentis TaxID=1680 RepID=A0A1X2ZMQ5_BIFAD|nr:hypothetical protein [Bifidobacterium adolescentis]OSG95682.1 autotransporter adhesin [Bifidobacterium adolescentis]